MKLPSFVNSWRSEPATKNQLEYIKRIWNESDMPLQPFTGKTKGEAAKWIDENRYKAYTRKENEG